MLNLKFHSDGHGMMGLAVFLQVRTLPAVSFLLLPGQNGLKEARKLKRVYITASSMPYFESQHGLNRFQSVREFIQLMNAHLNEEQVITLLLKNN